MDLLLHQIALAEHDLLAAGRRLHAHQRRHRRPRSFALCRTCRSLIEALEQRACADQALRVRLSAIEEALRG